MVIIVIVSTISKGESVQNFILKILNTLKRTHAYMLAFVLLSV